MRALVFVLAAATTFALACSDKKDKDTTKTVALPGSGRARASATASASSAVALSATASAATSASEPSATVATASAPLGAPPSGWPLDPTCVMDGKTSGCKTSDGGPGVRCGDGPCRNLCPAGMGPEPSGTFCEKLCKAPADCPGGRCTPAGVCDTAPVMEGCAGKICELPGGDMGIECAGKCTNPCRPGHSLFGGTQCAKRCKSPSDCPGGECGEEGFCSPLCPAEGCPYPW